MADKDLKFIQENVDGLFEERTVTPVSGQALMFDSEGFPVSGNAAEPFTLHDVTNAQRLAGTRNDDTTPLVAGDTVRVTDLPDDPIMLMLGTGDWTTISEPLQMPYFTAHTFVTTATDTVEAYNGDIPDDFASTNSLGSAKALSLGNSVTSIGSEAFYNCSGFTGYLNIPDSVTSIGNNAFRSCSGFTSLTIPDSVTTIGNNAFRSCSGFTSLTIPDSVTSIGSYAFAGCLGLTGSLTIPDSVTSIGNNVFAYCTGFTGSLTIADSVTSIGSYAFYTCTGFTGDLNIPDSVTSIGSSAFWGCTGFTGDLNIPDSVTSIGGQAFQGCSGFTSLTIPDSVTSIGGGVFRDCTNLTNVNCYVTKTIFNQSNVLAGTGVTTLHALASDGTWTAGADTIGGKALTVIKDLV